MKCEACNGHGKVIKRLKRAPGGSFPTVPVFVECETCSGSGRLPEGFSGA